MRITRPSSSVIMLEQRVRLLRGSVELHVAHVQPTAGVPALEPAPKMVNCMAVRA